MFTTANSKISAHNALIDWILRTLAIVGLGASVVLLWDYTQTSNMFCGPGQGCDLVRASRFAYIAGIPTPVFAVTYFLFILILLHLQLPIARRLLTLAATLGGFTGIALFIEQAVFIKAFCKYCCIGDFAQLSIAVLVLLNRKPIAPLTKRGRLGFSALFLIGFGAPFVFGLVTQPPAVSENNSKPISACVREANTGVITVVEFVDFQCPYCRTQHFALNRIVETMSAELGKPIRAVRKHFPLAMHKYAADAARVAVCAEAAGRGELMVDILFSADDLSLPALQMNASQLGIDKNSLTACMHSNSTNSRLADDYTCGKQSNITALPTFYIGETRFQGLQKDEKVITAIKRAAKEIHKQ
ncbi:MAG: thioredoxin domain-containing protein [Deltaproteobacteria bacterium]|nr:thioredoxin domain-containing protein [Deltaproteobacteria bacterium]